jgi:hypothetical protein
LTKKLKNELRDFPSPYDMMYWSDNGKTFNIPLYNRDLFTAVHNLCTKIELTKQAFPLVRNDKGFIYPKNKYNDEEESIEDIMDWFEKYIGTGGTGNGILGLGR